MCGVRRAFVWQSVIPSEALVLMTRTFGDRTYRSASDAYEGLLIAPYVSRFLQCRRAARLAIGARRPAATAATMTRLETRNGTSEPASSATERWLGLL